MYKLINTSIQSCYYLNQLQNRLFEILCYENVIAKEVILKHKLIVKGSTETSITIGLPHRD